MKGLNITIDSDYSSLMDFNAQEIFDASGVSELNRKLAVNDFIKKMKFNGLWDLVDDIRLSIDDTYNGSKFNLKNVDDLVIPPFLNGIHKGFVCTGVGNVGGGQVVIPTIDRSYVLDLLNGGHSMYFSNENLSPSSISVPGMCNPLSWTTSSAAQYLFLLSGSTTNINKKQVTILNKSAGITPTYTSKGSFMIVIDGGSAEFYGNGLSLGSAVFSGTTNSYVGNVAINDDKYPINNTISYVSFGRIPLNSDQVLLYTNLVNKLIFDLHAIII